MVKIEVAKRSSPDLRAAIRLVHRAPENVIGIADLRRPLSLSEREAGGYCDYFDEGRVPLRKPEHRAEIATRLFIAMKEAQERGPLGRVWLTFDGKPVPEKPEIQDFGYEARTGHGCASITVHSAGELIVSLVHWDGPDEILGKFEFISDVFRNFDYPISKAPVHYVHRPFLVVG